VTLSWGVVILGIGGEEVLELPDPDQAITTGGSKGIAIRSEADGVHAAFAPPVEDFLTFRDLPDFDRAIGAATGQP